MVSMDCASDILITVTATGFVVASVASPLGVKVDVEMPLKLACNAMAFAASR